MSDQEVRVTVDYWGMKPIAATVKASELTKRFCTVTVLDNPNAGEEGDRGATKLVPRGIVTPVAPEPFDTDCGEAWCSLVDPDIDNVVFECGHESECKAAFASGQVAS